MEVTGVFPSDAGEVVVQPGTMINDTSIREMQTVFIDKGDPDICYSLLYSSLFSTRLIIFIISSYLRIKILRIFSENKSKFQSLLKNMVKSGIFFQASAVFYYFCSNPNWLFALNLVTSLSD
jgi:hypothetical protein